eukprot:TRINITY_DN21503_c0_g2_i1.p3 TRINITY_DN21503_c0_g2~~TRINITY_DN21503_c0_g2_i1.p3  ORF type:complete len:103 (+),score=20.29 TRINITY_DN21503_c0_g2_i1:76-384(+)
MVEKEAYMYTTSTMTVTENRGKTWTTTEKRDGHEHGVHRSRGQYGGDGGRHGVYWKRCKEESKVELEVNLAHTWEDTKKRKKNTSMAEKTVNEVYTATETQK